MKDITGIILAGGKSQRMGQEKGLIQLGGKPLTEHALDILKPLCSAILISANTGAYDYLGYPVIHEQVKDIGPMGGLYSSLQASDNEHNLVLSCDMPFMETALLKFLFGNRNDRMAAVPWHGQDHYEPMCASYHKSFAPVLGQFIQSGNYKLPDVFRAYPVEALKVDREWPFFSEWLFYNINTTAQLQAAEKRLIT